MRNCLEEAGGIERDEGDGWRVEVEEGVKGDVVEGVESAFRLVDIESSMTERERRRKERRVEWEKQREGVRGGGEGGWDIMRRGNRDADVRVLCDRGVGGGVSSEDAEEAQNHASLM